MLHTYIGLEEFLKNYDGDPGPFICLIIMSISIAIVSKLRHFVFSINEWPLTLQIDLAGKAYATIKKDQVKVQNPNLRFTMDQFNQLVANHATKALEFVTVQVIESGQC